jgi:adenosylhomocysteine nucleosidase
MKTGMIVAMRQEIAPLLQRVGAYTRESLAGRLAYRFTLSCGPCILVFCGMGVKRARAAAEALIEAEHPELLVSFGVAGGVQEELQVADIVVARNATLLDGDVATHRLALYQPSQRALAAAARAVAASGATLYAGTTVTTRGSQAVRMDGVPLEHPVLEMETHGVAQAAAAAALPLLAVRALSDSVREPLPFDLAAFTDSDYNLHTSRFLGHILRHPRTFPRLLKLQANTRKAAKNAAAAVLAILTELDQRQVTGDDGPSEEA